MLHACSSCQDQPERKITPFTYNYSISVHHPDFVCCYMEIILPRPKELFPILPSCIQDYQSSCLTATNKSQQTRKNSGKRNQSEYKNQEYKREEVIFFKTYKIKRNKKAF